MDWNRSIPLFLDVKNALAENVFGSRSIDLKNASAVHTAVEHIGIAWATNLRNLF